MLELTFLRPQQSILRTREFPVAAFNRVNFFFHCIYEWGSLWESLSSAATVGAFVALAEVSRKVPRAVIALST